MKENQFEETMIDLTNIIKNQMGIETEYIHLKGLERNNDGDWEVQVYIQPYTSLQSIEVNFRLIPNGVEFGDDIG